MFAGVRKLTSCEDEEQQPGDGTEVSYLELELSSEEALQKFLDGEVSEESADLSGPMSRGWRLL